MDDAANNRAKLRSHLGLTRELQVDRIDLPPNLSIGSTRGYLMWFRQRVLATAEMMGTDVTVEKRGICVQFIRS